jgi:hypothetical protein
MRSHWFVALALVLSSGVGCDMLKPPPSKPFEGKLRVFGDPGEPLAGADVFYKTKQIGKSDASGTVGFLLHGAEGEVYDLTVKCPDGYQSPAKPVSVTLRKTTDKAARPEYDVDCPKTTRKVVVAVRADSGPNLPILYLGVVKGQTDQSGAAHIALDVPPNQMFQLQISTDGDKDLRPQNPTATFEVKQADELFVFEQKFKVEHKRVYRGTKKKETGPQPL